MSLAAFHSGTKPQRMFRHLRHGLWTLAVALGCQSAYGESEVLPNAEDRFGTAFHFDNLYMTALHKQYAPTDKLQLTIDARIQEIAQEALEAAVQKHRARSGCCIIMEPKSGDILAYTGNNEYILQRRIYSLVPEDIFTVIPAGALLDKGIYHLNSPISCSAINLPEDVEINTAFGTVNTFPLWAVIATSNKAGLTYLHTQMEKNTLGIPHLLQEYMTAFGLFERPGLNLPDENICMIRTTDMMSNESKQALGLDISSSPLHWVSVYATLANQGKRMKQHLVLRVRQEDGTIREESKPTEIKQVLSAEAAQHVCSILQACTRSSKENQVEHDGLKPVEVSENVLAPVMTGSARNLHIKGVAVAGKTGTAYKVKTEDVGDKKVVTSAIAILPADNPRFVILTIIDEPLTKRATGNSVAAPVLVNIAKQILTLPEPQPVNNQKNAPESTTDTPVAKY